MCALCMTSCSKCAVFATCDECFNNFYSLNDQSGCVHRCPDGNNYQVKGQYKSISSSLPSGTFLCQICPIDYCNSCEGTDGTTCN